MIFPLSFTLTAFLRWIIVSLNGTILHLSQRKQRSKLAMFKRLWRILVMSVIAIFAFFVISTMSLSGRLEEDYAARNWRYRWVLLDASLAFIYLVAFGAIAWLWRPVSFSCLILSMLSHLVTLCRIVWTAEDTNEAHPEHVLNYRLATMSDSPCRKNSHKTKTRPMRKTTKSTRSNAAPIHCVRPANGITKI